MKKIYEQPSARPIKLHFRSSVLTTSQLQLKEVGGDGNTLVRRRMWDEEEEQ